MTTLPFPETEALAEGLSAMHGRGGPVTVLRRRPNPYWSTFPSEVVTCRMPDGATRQLLCKYPRPEDRAHLAYGHRHGVGYEALVYRRVLSVLPVSAPRFFGARGRARHQTWFAIDYLPAAERIGSVDRALPLAARWAGQFHRENAALLARTPLPSLARYDAAYYEGWVGRFRDFGRDRLRRSPWLAVLCDRYGDVVDRLLSAPPVVVHGEFYPKNILVHRGEPYPVDWESAAVAAGETDLASLTEGWPSATAAACARAYAEARWPQGAPPEFPAALDAARVYLAFRWLGDRPDWTVSEEAPWLFRQLRTAGRRLGLV